MRYHPFSPEKHQELLEQLRDYAPDFATQRAVRNFRYYEDAASFGLIQNLEHTEVFFALKDKNLDLSQYAPMALKGLSLLLQGLVEADRLDSAIAATQKATQFEVIQTFRFFHQTYGGRRYVDLCRDLIDANMSKSLQPYMYSDLVLSVFLNYNKNTSRDVDGLLDGVLSFISDVDLNDKELRNLFSSIGLKCSEANYSSFARKCLQNPKVSSSMSAMIVDSFTPSSSNSRDIPPVLYADDLARLPKESLVEILKKFNGGQRLIVEATLLCFGDEIDPDLVVAYMQNRHANAAFIQEAPFFASLPPELRKRFAKRKTFTAATTAREMIRYFESVRDDDEMREEALFACAAAGKPEVAKMLSGEDFVFTGFSVSDLPAAAPYLKFDSPTMAPRIRAVLTRFVVGSYASEELDRFLLQIPVHGYEDVMRRIINTRAIYSYATYYALLDRFGWMGERGFKEWRYHD